MRVTTIGSIAVVAVALLITQPFVGSSQNGIRPKKALTSEQLSLIEGRGCNFWEWLAAIAADIGCAVVPDPWGCLAALGTTADCIAQLGGPDPTYNNTPQAANTNPTKGAPKN